MSSQDAGFLYFEKPSTPLHIGSTSILEGHISRDELVDHMAARMHRLPRYRQKAIFAPFNVGHPAWEDDQEFTVARHVSEVSLAKGAGDAELKQAIAAAFTPMLPRDRPLWNMTLIQGLPGGRSAVQMLVHHCMVDGVSGVELLMVATDLAADVPPSEPEPFRPAPPLTPAEHAAAAYWDSTNDAVNQVADGYRVALDPARQVREMQAIAGSMLSAAPFLLRPAPGTPFNGGVTSNRVCSWLELPFGEIRGIRAMLGGTVNDVVLTTLSGGIGAYLRELGVNTEGMELRAMVPVNVRSESEKAALGNRVSMFIAPLPVGIKDVVARHQRVVSEMGRLKASNQAGGFEVLSRLSAQVPPAFQAAAGLVAGSQSLLNMVCTNVPGPQIPLYMAGRKIEAMYPLVPLSQGMGLNCALLSYNGTLYWGICAEPGLVPDVDRVASALRAAFEDIRAAAVAASTAAPAPDPVPA
ncbi:MAG: wax ester/triacylglycerol synthase family O-acyltransferase [Dehalococcoidia bacterium]